MTVPIHNGIYYIPVDSFKKNIKSLAQFIDALDLTTVYQKGKSIGCRIGKSGKDTLASKLGLIKDDILQQIDGIPVTDIASRVLIYDHVIQKKVHEEIDVKLDRSGKEMHFKYLLSDVNMNGIDLKMQPKAGTAKVTTEQEFFDLEQERKKMLEQKVKFAPTAQQIQMDERNKILQARNKELFAKSTNTNTIQQPKMSDVDHFAQKSQIFDKMSGA